MALAAAYTAGAALAFGAAPADEADILARAGEYISRYEASLAMIVAEETYEQRYFTPHDSRPTEKRVLRSEVLIARLPLDVRWVMYRDVLSVDGREVGGEKGRLERIFRESHANALEKARALMRESARFNLGPVERNFNVPTLALAFLVPGNQERVAFASAYSRRRASRRAVMGDPSGRGEDEADTASIQRPRHATPARVLDRPGERRRSQNGAQLHQP